ncbi:hypothetical protein ACFE04_001943 [Oxalis oulophora]
MGSIGGEEVKKMEKMQTPSAREQKILVLIRLRPLNDREILADESADWECINDTTILYRNTLREGSTFPSAYSFDRVFRGDSSTKQVYEEGAKDIALSVVNGINSTIFAYGQTSSGKTYTMVGITEYAVADIFDYIYKHEERAFVVKFSAIEIYNEAIRDLLSSDNTPLRLRDDPEKGATVEKITEETLKDWNHLTELISLCEAQRRIGETSLNEKSSRSHQIIRLTIESSAREFIGKENSATLAASVNFVDLAGSERASQASSAGVRLKEGCHINRSLLTLGTVIRKLSKGRQGHINYRDSKLTRMLQPCLGGNSRTAVVCTLSPARSHVEQTRNTLLFACCAKEVTTKAQVNVVMSDKALVKHLQKELARLESELRSPLPASLGCDYVALLRKRDLQIQKMEKDIRELTKQRDLAQSRIEDLLRIIGDDQDSRQSAGNGFSVSESSEVVNSHRSAAKKSNGNHFYDTESENSPEESYNNLNGNHEDNYSDNGDSDEYCKEVQCIETNDSMDKFSGSRPRHGVLALSSFENGVDENALARESSNGFRYSPLVQRLHNVHESMDSPWNGGSEMSSSRNLRLTRSSSCRETFTNNCSSSPFSEKSKPNDNTPVTGMEKNFPGRPQSVRRRFPDLDYGGNTTSLSRSSSQSSLESESTDDPNLQSIITSADEEITSINAFVAGLKEAKSLYGKGGHVEEDGTNNKNLEMVVNDVGMDPTGAATQTLSNWPSEFARQRRAIVELWQTCNVPLVHRTYFFLLFKGDPADSIYMEVELRRLSFLNETFSQGNHAMEHGEILSLTSRSHSHPHL